MQLPLLSNSCTAVHMVKARCPRVPPQIFEYWCRHPRRCELNYVVADPPNGRSIRRTPIATTTWPSDLAFLSMLIATLLAAPYRNTVCREGAAFAELAAHKTAANRRCPRLARLAHWHAPFGMSEQGDRQSRQECTVYSCIQMHSAHKMAIIPLRGREWPHDQCSSCRRLIRGCRRRRLSRLSSYQDIHVQSPHHLHDEADAVEEGIDRHAQHAVRGGLVGRAEDGAVAVAGGVVAGGSRTHGKRSAHRRRELLVNREGLQGDLGKARGREGNVDDSEKKARKRKWVSMDRSLWLAGPSTVRQHTENTENPGRLPSCRCCLLELGKIAVALRAHGEDRCFVVVPLNRVSSSFFLQRGTSR